MRRNLYLNVILLLIAVLLVGCLGGSGTVTDEQKIHSLLNQYQTAVKGMDAEGIANLFSYPIEFDGEILENKEQAIFIFSFMFELVRIHEYELKDRKIIIDSSGTDATIEGIIFAKATSLWGTETNSQPFLMGVRKVGSQWKISGM